ncbi:MAG: DNA-3-methyladenine glycosylase [Roseburia sp.]|nr:DNA-3-methyladenine glycosylase [Roseburia sp.]MCM1096765.1 DNA-3-methyladenine glycosylase [Ruminococcus flavefaciens]
MSGGRKDRQGMQAELFQESSAEEAERRKRLDRGFFARDGITVARELLGKILVHRTSAGFVRGIITEAESYMGEEDKGSHTYGGRRTERTEPMYHTGGTSYVYLIYGMYSCMNIAAMTEGIPQAVLLRSVVPADPESRERMYGLRLAEMQRRRGRREEREKAEERQVGGSGGMFRFAGRDMADRAVDKLPKSLEKHLADGPGKLCIAMGITRADNDIDLTVSEDFYVTEGIAIEPEQIRAGKRIGIDYAEEAADYLWRFYLEPSSLEG